MNELEQTHFDIRMALLAIMILGFISWLWGGLPPLVAGLIIVLALYTFMRLFPVKRGKA